MEGTAIGKIMISLSDKMENKMRKEIERLYHGRIGGLSIFFEMLVREHFRDHLEKKKDA